MKTDWLHSATWAVIGSATRATALVSLATVCMGINEAAADEAGISFWLPGLYGSFAAAPGEPGWSFASVFYHPSVSAGAGTSFPEEAVSTSGLKAEVKSSLSVQPIRSINHSGAHRRL